MKFKFLKVFCFSKLKLQVVYFKSTGKTCSKQHFPTTRDLKNNDKIRSSGRNIFKSQKS